MAYTTAGKNRMLSDLISVGTRLTLHTADPGSTGLNQVSGGSYEAQTITWGSPSNGVVAASNAPVFQIPAATTITHFSISNSTGTEWYAAAALSASETYTNAGTFTADSIELNLNN